VKFTLTYPLIAHPYSPEFVCKEGVIRFAQAAERAGFDGFGVTDHPAPTDRWLNSGGHDALDPFAALAFVAAVTDRLRLIPNILVLPYRNPFLVAKSVATIDALSGGRFTLAVAAGYLKGEYAALGVDFEERNALFDEALEVIRGVWAEDNYAFEGRHFSARGQSLNPKPASVPIWIGGNSALARRRVAAGADGWAPFPAPRVMATTAKSPPLETLDDFSAMVGDLWRLVDEAGRDRSSIDIAFGSSQGGSPGDDGFNAAAQIDGLGQLAELGVTWASVGIPGDSMVHALEVIERYGAEVIAPLRR
jgi:probable F420-dependent oxidoreductase